MRVDVDEVAARAGGIDGDSTHKRRQTEGPLDRLVVQHEGYVDPTFRRLMREVCPDLRIFWNRLTRRWSFYKVKLGRGLGATSHWKDPANWYGGIQHTETREMLRARLSLDLEWRSRGLVPIMEHGPDDGPLDGRVLLTILLGDDPTRPGVGRLLKRVSAESLRKVDGGQDLDKIDTWLFRKALQAKGSPWRDLIDIDVKAKLYRDDKRSEHGEKPLPFKTPAEEPRGFSAVPS